MDTHKRIEIYGYDREDELNGPRNASSFESDLGSFSWNGSAPDTPLFHASSWEIFRNVYVTLLLIVAAAIVVANLLVIVLFVRSRRLRSVHHWFVMSLAFSDIQVGCVDTPIWVYILLNPHNISKELCLFNWTYPQVIFLASVYSILGITVDRFVSIRWPLKYRLIVTRRKTAVFIALVWSLSFVIAFIPVMDSRIKINLPANTSIRVCSHVIKVKMQFFKTSALILVLPPVLAIIILYILIVKIVTNHVANREYFKVNNKDYRISKTMEQESLSDKRESGLHATTKSAMSVYKKMSYAAKSVRVFCIVLVCILMSWVPFLVALDLASSCENCHRLALFIVVITSNLLSNCTAAVNPWLYTLRTRDFSEETRRLLASLGVVKYSGASLELESSLVTSRRHPQK